LPLLKTKKTTESTSWTPCSETNFAQGTNKPAWAAKLGT
jgi:hypothetical protein